MHDVVVVRARARAGHVVAVTAVRGTNHKWNKH